MAANLNLHPNFPRDIFQTPCHVTAGVDSPFLPRSFALTTALMLPPVSIRKTRLVRRRVHGSARGFAGNTVTS
jgi:hypothetical protein